mgnify:CR=1 FL=1
MDLIEIDAASHRGIDDVRELREGIKFAPVKSKYKIFIIDECHQLSKDAANALLAGFKNPFSRVTAVEFIANDSDALMTQCLLREPGDKITIIETVTGIDMDYFINGVELNITAPATIRCRWAVTPADTQQYWILGVAGSSELGVTTFLGY